jgi:DNA-binding MarR family transcriptional regulator
LIRRTRRPAADATASIGPIDSVIGFHLRRASFIFSPDVRTARGFPRWELSILSVVSANEGISQSSLGKTLRIDPGNLIPQLNRLIKQGLMTRAVIAADRRFRLLALTAAGEARLRDAMSRVRTQEAQILTDLTAAERRTLLELLKRVHTPAGSSHPAIARAVERGVNAR